jgi:spermidine synthase
MDRRIAQPKISEDLNRVAMGNATDFLSYFVMGNDGMKAFSEDGIINTDDNLYIEFHAPFSINSASVVEENINAIIKYRESILPYLVAAQGKSARAGQERRWSDHPEAVDVTGRAVALFLQKRFREAQFQKLTDELSTKYPSFAPGRFLKRLYMAVQGFKELQKTDLAVIDEKGVKTVVEISAVFVPVSPEQGSLVFIDINTSVIYGELYVRGRNRDEFINRFVIEVMTDIRAAYRKEVDGVLTQKGDLPWADPMLQKIKKLIGNKIRKGNQF